MSKIKGWGVLLAICAPLLIFYSWGKLGSTASRINLERYESAVGKGEAAFSQPLVEYFQKTRMIPVAGNVSAPSVPANSGIKSWDLKPNGVFAIELDARIDGKAVVLQMVPLFRGDALGYDCISTTSAVHVGKFCRPNFLQTVGDITVQLQINQAVLAKLPRLEVTNAGATAGMGVGSIVVLPDELDKVGLCAPGCIKPLACINERQLLCAATVERNGVRFQEISATTAERRGMDFATEADANAFCTQALGAGHSVAQTGDLGAQYKDAQPKLEYWAHNSLNPLKNCWRPS